MMHYDESYSTLLFATRAMSVRTRVIMNEKVEYKYQDEQGRPVSPMSAFTNRMSQNELML